MKCLNPYPMKVGVKRDKTILSPDSLVRKELGLINRKAVADILHLLPSDFKKKYQEAVDNEAVNTKQINLLVPCGKCIVCRRKRLNGWILRATHEYQENFKGLPLLFITLTYDNEHLGSPSLEYLDFQLFMKRLRKMFPECRFKYIVCGEYGLQTLRKHFHLTLFGLTHLDREVKDKIRACWNNGFISVKKADINSIKYVLKYSFKEYFQSKKMLEEMGLTLPMFRVSKGFGKDFCEKYGFEIYKNSHLFSDGKVSFAFPRYYYNIFYKLNLLDGWHFLNDYDEVTLEYMINTLLEIGLDVSFLYKRRSVEMCDLKKFVDLTKDYFTTLNNKSYVSYFKGFEEAI